MTIKRIEFLAHARVQLDKTILEYMDEAEHQDGTEYWDQFETVDEAFNDFVTYLYSKEEYKGDVFKG